MVEFIDKPITKRTPSSEGSSSSSPEPIKLKHSINIPGYTILSKLGERVSSTVWQARQESLNRLVAIKVLKKQYSTNQQEVDDFISEAKAVAKLKSPNIIQVYDIGNHKDTFYFVMEYIEGKTLNHLLKTEINIPQKKALSIAFAVASALEEAWNRSKIVHCDIKPENIMLENDGSIKVANLGLAGIINRHAETSSGKDVFHGTPNYMSPEQFDGKVTIDYHSDMYSLGATLYHMVTGHIPFIEKKESDIATAHKFEQLPCPSDVKPNITPGCCQIITRLMMKDSGYRFKEWSTVCRDLEKLAEGKIVVTKVSASMVSTVAKPGKVASPVNAARPLAVASKNKNEDSEKRKKDLKKKYSKKRAPVWLRIPLELLMLAWFGWLGYQLIWLPLNPVDPNKPQPVILDEAETPSETIPNNVGAGIKPESTVIQSAPKEEPVSLNPFTAKPQPEPKVEKTPEVRSELDNNSSVVPLPELINDILGMLLKNNSAGAVALLNESYPKGNESAQVSELSGLLSSKNINGNAVANAFKNNKGKTITIIYRGSRKKIKVTSVKQQTISADLYTSTGTSEKTIPIKFKISQLDPREQSRQLGKATSPDIAVAKFLLHMHAGDYINARSLAEKCGPLSEPCITEVDAKIKMIMQ